MYVATERELVEAFELNFDQDVDHSRAVPSTTLADSSTTLTH